MSKCRLYAWGANSHGQLGLGFQSEQSTLPQAVNLSSLELDPRDIEKIVGGAGHTLMLDKRGRVYSCGWNSKGQTARSNDRGAEVVLDFRRIDELEGERIRDVACGWDGSMALTENGHVFVWGSNCYGQLGRNERGGEAGIPGEPDKLIGLDEGIKGIAMGLRHSALVTEGGKVLVTGTVPGLENVDAVACGQNHTVAAKKTSEIYSWGDNKHGQLGVDTTKHKRIGSPRELEAPGMGEIGELHVGWTHTSFLNADKGRIFSWGRNTYGQLGYREEENNVTWIPRPVPIASKIRQLAVGSEHNVALTEDGTVLSWGWNEHGNCGNGNTRDVLVPERVELSRGAEGILVGSGAGHSFAIVIDDV